MLRSRALGTVPQCRAHTSATGLRRSMLITSKSSTRWLTFSSCSGGFSVSCELDSLSHGLLGSKMQRCLEGTPKQFYIPSHYTPISFSSRYKYAYVNTMPANVPPSETARNALIEGWESLCAPSCLSFRKRTFIPWDGTTEVDLYYIDLDILIKYHYKIYYF